MKGTPLHILHVIPAIASRYGGPSTLVLELARTLETKGHRVQIVTSDADGDRNLVVRPGTLTRYQGVWVRFFPRRLGESFKYAPGMAQWLRDRVTDFDVVHIHAVYSWSTIAAGWACLRSGVPFVVRPLGSLDPYGLGRRSLLKRALGLLVLNRILGNASRIHYTSTLEQRAAESGRTYARGVVIPNAVAMPAPNQLIAPRLIASPYILYLGRIAPKKKLETLVKGFFAADIDAAVHLVIAGDGDPQYRDRLVKLVNGYKNPGRVVFFGWADEEARDTLITHCMLTVLISENENFGLAVAEAMARSRPVVVDQGVYLHETIGAAEAGWVVAAAKPQAEALARTLHAALSSRDELTRRGESARNLVAASFTWETVSDQVVTLYADCAGQRISNRQRRHKECHVTAMVFTLDESVNLPHCLATLDWCDDVIVVDSGSSDQTVSIAAKFGARVFVNHFEGFGIQRNWALDHCAPRHPWVLMLDADERVPDALASEVNDLATGHPDGVPVAAARMARRFYMWGKWLRFSSQYPVWLVRLVHRDHVRYLNRGHAETQEVDGEIVALGSDLIDENHKGMEAWQARQSRYALADARYELDQQGTKLRLSELLSSDPLVRKMALKRVSFRLPLRKQLYLCYGLLIRQGFRDGRAGLKYNAMRADYQQQIVECKKTLLLKR